MNTLAFTSNKLLTSNLEKAQWFSSKEKQMIASNWLLNKELRSLLDITDSSWSGQAVKAWNNEGKIFHMGETYLITWLVSPEVAYKAPFVRLSFRKATHDGACLSYVVINL